MSFLQIPFKFHPKLLSFVPAQLTACRMQPHPAKRTWGGLHLLPTYCHVCWGKYDQTWEFGGSMGSVSANHQTWSNWGSTRWLIFFFNDQFVTNQLKRSLQSLASLPPHARILNQRFYHSDILPLMWRFNPRLTIHDFTRLGIWVLNGGINIVNKQQKQW